LARHRLLVFCGAIEKRADVDHWNAVHLTNSMFGPVFPG
jgi:hypothetical protein